jgi:long-subunit fatty acid transport protein
MVRISCAASLSHALIRSVGAVAAAFALGLAGPAGASPIDDPHIGGIGFSGPTTGDLAAVYWNPAALGVMPDSQVLVAATGRFASMTLARAPIDPATGRPGGSRSFPQVGGESRLHPLAWPPGPGGFVGISAALGTRFTLALAAFSPFVQKTTWAPAADGQEVTRYHAVQIDLRNVALAPAFALRLCCGLRVGASPTFLFTVGRLVFDEDTALAGGSAGLAGDCGGNPCGVENPAAAARYQIDSGLSPTDSSFSVMVSGGLLLQRPRWDAGLTYITRPVRTDHGVTIKGRSSHVAAPARAPGGPLCPSEDAGACFYAEAQYELPDTLIAGFTYHLNDRLDLTAILRWMNLSRHEAIDIRVMGPATNGLRPHGLPEQILLHRGFQDSEELRLRATLRLGERLLVSATLRGETSAVAAEEVSPAAVDGFKLEPAFAARVRLGPLQLSAGYAFTFMPSVTNAASVFDPSAAVTCTDAGGDLGNAACEKRSLGLARPTAAGTYSLSAHAFSLSLAVRL